jgi:hypothetical protein
MSDVMSDPRLCIFIASARVMEIFTQDEPPPSVLKWRIEQLVRLLHAVHYPADTDEAAEATVARGARPFGEFTASYRGARTNGDEPA